MTGEPPGLLLAKERKVIALLQVLNIENVVVDEATKRTYIILAPRLLSDGEIYRPICQEILRREGKPVAQGETLTLTVMLRGNSGSHVA